MSTNNNHDMQQMFDELKKHPELEEYSIYRTEKPLDIKIGGIRAEYPPISLSLQKTTPDYGELPHLIEFLFNDFEWFKISLHIDIYLHDNNQIAQQLGDVEITLGDTNHKFKSFGYVMNESISAGSNDYIVDNYEFYTFIPASMFTSLYDIFNNEWDLVAEINKRRIG